MTRAPYEDAVFVVSKTSSDARSIPMNSVMYCDQGNIYTTYNQLVH